MNYLKSVNEKVSDVFEDNLKFLFDASGYTEVSADIKDIFTDLCDEFEGSKFTLQSYIHLRYKTNKVNRKTDINLSYYAQPTGTLNSTDKRYLNDFVSKTESASVMKINFGIEFKIPKITELDVDSLCSQIDDTIHLLKSYGYDAKIVNKRSSVNDPATEIKNLKSEINNNKIFYASWDRSGNPHPYHIHIEFVQDIDTEVFKPGNEYLAKLPEKIVADFKTFCDRFRMNSSDREQLANLIQKSQS